jgi:hypothetical protein
MRENQKAHSRLRLKGGHLFMHQLSMSCIIKEHIHSVG